MIVITGATGHLGRLVIHALLRSVPAGGIVAAVRNPEKAADLSALGIVVRQADYAQPETLQSAFAGAEKLLLISSNAIGERKAQHGAVIAAAKEAGVGLVAYTSVLHADDSPLGLAAEHRETEAQLKASGLPFVLLRNGWYTENYLGSVATALAHGALLGSAGEGRIAAAARADYADAAAAVLTRDAQAGKVYELAGDSAFTMQQLASEIARQSGQSVVYRHMPEAEYQTALQRDGLPESIAVMIANSSAATAEGALFDDGRALSTLIGRPTTPMADSVAAALKP